MFEWAKRSADSLSPGTRRLFAYLVFGGCGIWLTYSVNLALETGEITSRHSRLIQYAINPAAFQYEVHWKAFLAVVSFALVAVQVIKDIRQLLSR